PPWAVARRMGKPPPPSVWSDEPRPEPRKPHACFCEPGPDRTEPPAAKDPPPKPSLRARLETHLARANGPEKTPLIEYPGATARRRDQHRTQATREAAAAARSDSQVLPVAMWGENAAILCREFLEL